MVKSIYRQTIVKTLGRKDIGLPRMRCLLYLHGIIYVKRPINRPLFLFHFYLLVKEGIPMIIDMTVTLVINLMLLLSMSFIQQLIPNFKRKFIKPVLIGLYTGVVGVVLMSIPFEFYDGMIFDTRSILISSTGIFFGAIPTAITWVFLISYRLYIGGAGVLAAFINISQAGLIGLLFRKYRIKNKKRITNSWKELLTVSYVVHIIMFLLVFTLPVEDRNAILPHLWYMVLLFLPISGVHIYIFHRYQVNLNTQKEHIVQYRDLFENSHVALMLIDGVDGKIIDVNKTALDFYGWSLSELTQMYIYQINTKSKEVIMKEIHLCATQEQGYFSNKHRTKDRGLIDVEVYSGPIRIEDKTVLLSTIIDATFKVENEKLQLEKQKQLEYIGYHDYLTGLYNRMFFEIELKRLSTKRQLPLSIIIGDVNNLKITNDKHSHIDGDQLLIEIAKILKDTVRSEDIVARWGGDEFVILLPQSNEHIVKNIIQRIQKKCKASKAKITPSIALGYFTQREISEDIYKGLKTAEERMYKQKRSQKG